jgi:hypothetical protein
MTKAEAEVIKMTLIRLADLARLFLAHDAVTIPKVGFEEYAHEKFD